MKKKIFNIALTLVVLVGITLKLISNKNELVASARLAEKISGEIPVKVEKVKTRTLGETWEATGYSEANKSVKILAQAGGEIVGIHFRKGQQVKKGMSIAQIDDALLRAKLTTAETNRTKAKKDLERIKILHVNKAATDTQLEKATLTLKQAISDLKNLTEQQRYTKVIAPFSGTLSNDFIEIGQVVNSGSHMADLLDMNLMKVKVMVPERRVRRLRIGDEVLVEFKAIHETFSGSVSFIAEKAGKGGNFETEVLVKNTDQIIKSGMFASAYFKENAKENTLSIPRKAIAGSVLNPEVFILKGDKVQLKKIVLGKNWGDYYTVKSGLNSGEEVITEGIINLVDGVKVKVIR